MITLARTLQSGTYISDPYIPFYVLDPKRRHIHKATVRDRIVHQAIFRVLSPIFEKQFIDDSFACRKWKGTHRGVDRLEHFLIRGSRNNQQVVWALKCDIRKFFDSIDHEILRSLIRRRVQDRSTLMLIDIVLNSFEKQKGKGLPLGNVTSQLFGNIYLHELDRYVKYSLKCKHYVRYCDDFILIDSNKEFLESCVSKIADFLDIHLKVSLHPYKVIIRKYSQGIDFLGYVLLPHYRVLRRSTKKRIIGNFARGLNDNQKNSYFGVLSHAKCFKLKKQLEKM